MKRIDHSTADHDAFGIGKDGFKLVAPFTVCTPDWANSLQEELATMLEGFGIALNPAQTDQLYRAMRDANRTAVTETDASVPIFGATADAGDHPGSPSNRWKLILQVPASDNTKVRILAGDGVNGTWTITSNAAWDPSGAQWGRDSNAQEANRLLCVDGSLSWHGKAAGASPWADGAWDATRGNAFIGDSLDVGGDIDVGGDLSVGGAVTSTLHLTGVGVRLDCDGDMNVDGSLVVDSFVSSASFDFPVAQTRRISQDLMRGGGTGATQEPDGEYWELNPGGRLNLGLIAPHGSTLAEIRVKLSSLGADFTLEAVRVTANMTTTALPSFTAVATNTGSVLSAVQNEVVSFGGLTAAAGESYRLRITSDPGSSDPLFIHFVDLQVTAPGPIIAAG